MAKKKGYDISNIADSFFSSSDEKPLEAELDSVIDEETDVTETSNKSIEEEKSKVEIIDTESSDDSVEKKEVVNRRGKSVGRPKKKAIYNRKYIIKPEYVDDPRKVEVKNVKFQLMITPSVAEALDEYAENNSVSRNDTIYQILFQWMLEQENKEAGE